MYIKYIKLRTRTGLSCKFDRILSLSSKLLILTLSNIGIDVKEEIRLNVTIINLIVVVDFFVVVVEWRSWSRVINTIYVNIIRCSIR